MRCFTKSQTFNPDWPNQALKEQNRAQMGRKHGFQELGVVSHSFYV